MTFLLPEFLKVCFSCSYVAWSLKKHSSPDNGNWHFRFDLLSIFPTSCFQFFLTFSFFMFVSHCSRCSVFCSVAIWKTFKKFLTKRLLFHSNAIAWIPQDLWLLFYGIFSKIFQSRAILPLLLNVQFKGSWTLISDRIFVQDISEDYQRDALIGVHF